MRRFLAGRTEERDMRLEFSGDAERSARGWVVVLVGLVLALAARLRPARISFD